MSSNNPSYLGLGVYSVAEASRLTQVPRARIRRWLSGYTYEALAGNRLSRPVVTNELPSLDGEVALSFLDLIEVRVVNSLRRLKINWKVIRLAERHAREIFNIDHPFATKRFKTDGCRIFASLLKKHGERSLVDLFENQLTFRKFVEPHLKDIEFDSSDQAAIWRPMGSRNRVLLDPKRSFGQPIVREGVPTIVLARAFKTQNSMQSVARWYEVDVRAVRDAVEFERKIAA